MMKLARLKRVVVGTTLAAVGAMMILTNPGRLDYEQYATRELTAYIKDNLCARAKAGIEIQALLRSYCKTLADTGRPFLQESILLGTTRNNFLIFSIYQTELSFPPPIPSYQFSTIAVFRRFFIYDAREI